jgi:hypothetical protein
MRGVAKAALLVGLVGLFVPGRVFADQRQDWVIAAPENGTFVNLDFIIGALQAGIEHRMPVYGKANQLILRGSGLAALPFGQGQADVELRMLVLTLGTSAGYMSSWRNQTFALGEPLDRKERRERDSSGEFNTDSFGFWEGRATLALPFNDYVVFLTNNAYRITGATKRSFDNVTAVVDDGRFERTNFQLFFKHERLGGLAPTFEILNFPLDDHWHTQFNWGFQMVTRAGLVMRDDLIVFQMMFHSGKVFGGGYDNRDVYGNLPTVIRGPATFLLVYRSQIQL